MGQLVEWGLAQCQSIVTLGQAPLSFYSSQLRKVASTVSSSPYTTEAIQHYRLNGSKLLDLEIL